MVDNIYNTLSAASLFFLMFIIPALICGGLVALPSVFFSFLQRFSHRRFPKLNLFIVSLTGIGSFALALLYITRSIIGLSYALTIPSAPNAAEKQLFESVAIDEATYRSLVPVYFQKPCTRTPEIVCQLGSEYTIDAWNSIPVISGIVAAITSILIGLRAQNAINPHPFPDHEAVQIA
jgi:hypothetical protein